MALRPVVTRSALTEHKVVGSEKSTAGTGSNRVHGTRLQVDEDSARNILVASDFVVVDLFE